jgi:hypothetical protein
MIDRRRHNYPLTENYASSVGRGYFDFKGLRLEVCGGNGLGAMSFSIFDFIGDERSKQSENSYSYTKYTEKN